MLAKMIDKIVSLKETKIFEIDGQTYADASLTRIPPHVDRPDCISVSGLDSICKLIRTELEKVSTTIMVQEQRHRRGDDHLSERLLPQHALPRQG
jgi:hypothetical protein